MRKGCDMCRSHRMGEVVTRGERGVGGRTEMFEEQEFGTDEMLEAEVRHKPDARMWVANWRLGGRFLGWERKVM